MEAVIDRYLRKRQQYLVRQIPQGITGRSSGYTIKHISMALPLVNHSGRLFSQEYELFRPHHSMLSDPVVMSPKLPLTYCPAHRSQIVHEHNKYYSPESVEVYHSIAVNKEVGVLDIVLPQLEWLVGCKCTFSNLAFNT